MKPSIKNDETWGTVKTSQNYESNRHHVMDFETNLFFASKNWSGILISEIRILEVLKPAKKVGIGQEPPIKNVMTI